MKKSAIRGLLILGAVVLLCVFFSGTLHTLGTAKVRLALPRSGRLETTLRLSGALRWPAGEPVTVPEMTSEDTLVLRRLTVSAGSRVKAGDLLAQCDVSDYDTRMASLQNSWQAKEQELLSLQAKNISITPQQESWYAAYQRAASAASAEQQARQRARLEARLAGVTLDENDAPEAGAQLTEGLGQALTELKAAAAESAEARQAFEALSRYPVSEAAVAWLNQREALQKELTALSERMEALALLKARAERITAPHDGYVTAAELKAGDTVSNGTPVVTLTAEGADPVVRLNLTDLRRALPEQAKLTLLCGDRSVESQILTQGVAPDGTVYADAALKQGDIGALGGAAALTESGAVTAEITLRAENTTTLIPISALRGTEGDWYVYCTERRRDSFGTEKIMTVKKPVTVLGQSASAASVEESLRGEELVYMEDRPLTEGCEVMPYGTGS